MANRHAGVNLLSKSIQKIAALGGGIKRGVMESLRFPHIGWMASLMIPFTVGASYSLCNLLVDQFTAGPIYCWSNLLVDQSTADANDT